MIWNAGIAFILWFQGLGGWLTVPMKMFTFLGSEEFFLVALPLVYWCIDAAAGLQIGLILLFSTGVNETLKLAMRGPRPYWFSTQVRALAAESSFGVPSGHAQNAAALWGMAAVQTRKRLAWAGALAVIVLIGLSRLYLAVHFPHDVLLGWLFGMVILWLFFKFWAPISAWAGRKTFAQQALLAFAASLTLVVMGLLAFGSLRGWVVPQAWMDNASLAGVDVLPAPISLKGTMTSAGVLFGMLTGVAWMNTRGGFDARGGAGQRALRLLPGLAGVLILYIGLGQIFPHGEDFVANVFRYARYALVGAWISAGAPWVFLKLGLASRTGR